MLYSLIFLLALFIGASKATQNKQCQIQIDALHQRAQILFSSFEKQDFDDVVAETMVIDKYLNFLIQDCPVLYEKQNTDLKTPIDCQKNIHEIKQLLQGDIVSNFQKIKDINDFFSTSCLPSDYMHNGFKQYMQTKLEDEEQGNKYKCLGCKAMVASLQEYIKANNITDLNELLENKGLCLLVPKGLLHALCYSELGNFSKQLIAGIQNGENSDVICNTRFEYCNGWHQCKLHGQSPPFIPPQNYEQLKKEQEQDINLDKKIHPVVNAALPNWLKKLMHKIFTEHLPMRDLDGDKFSTQATLRGYDWRGKDCSPFNHNIYPGRKKYTGIKGTDFNCNGIHGVDHQTGVPLKDKLCNKSQQMGSITIGDSAGAHFSLPPKYLDGAMWNNETFSDFIPKLENEFDIPQKSPGTGFKEDINGSSFYLKLLNRNRCNRNDYQNLAVNGASSRDTMPNMLAIARNQQLDHPALVFWELVGNDVCGRVPEEMTTSEQFRKNIITLWNKLDTILPRGSHMVVSGVGDGRILYDCLHNRTHPLGVSYSHFYDFLYCMDVSPCSGWMNSNKTVREQTSQRARELNQVYREVIANHTWKNFDVQYYDLPLEEAFGIIEAKGMHCWDGIEPSDGFHPNQLSDELWADILWKKLEKDHPDWLGPINPHNDEIVSQFGSKLTVEHIIDDEQEEIELQ